VPVDGIGGLPVLCGRAVGRASGQRRILDEFSTEGDVREYRPLSARDLHLLRVALIVLAALFYHTAVEEAEANQTYLTGYEVLLRCSGDNDAQGTQCLGYLQGIADVMLAGNEVNGYHVCIPPGILVGQLEDIALQFLRANPAVRHAATAGLVAKAYQQSFPCR